MAPYGTTSSRTHSDQFASHVECLDAQAYWHGIEPAVAARHSPTRPSSSSSLAGALDGGACRPPRRTHTFPDSEVVPVAAPLHRSLAPPHIHAGAETPFYLDSQLQQYPASPDGYWSDELMSAEALSPHERMRPPYATYAPALLHHAASELGCMNGQLVQTGIMGNPYPTDGVRLPSPVPAFHAPRLPPAASRFQLTRSYTLEGAVTFKEHPKPARPPVGTAQTPPRGPPAPSPDAARAHPASAPVAARPKKRLPAAHRATARTPPPPHGAANSSALFTRFSAKQPFMHVLAPSPSSAGDRSDGEGVLESVGEDPPPAKKKPAMACLFCRERKICCGPPAPDSSDPRCKQCVKRDQTCVFPTECRRGQHKRTPRKATIQALADAAARPADTPAADGCGAPGKGKVPTQKERAATTPRRARSSDAQAQAGHRPAARARAAGMDVVAHSPSSASFGPLSSAV